MSAQCVFVVLYSHSLHACFGQELKSLQDPFWLNFDGELNRWSSELTLQRFITFTCGGENKLSRFVMRTLGVRTIDQVFDTLGDLTEKFAMDKQNNVKRDVKDENIKLFNDFIEEYTSSSDGKYAKKQLLLDMTTMFFAATDTVCDTSAVCL